MMLHHEKPETLQPIISSVWCLYVKTASYIKISSNSCCFFLIHFCFQIEYWRTLKKFDKNKLAYRVHPFSLISVIMNLKNNIFTNVPALKPNLISFQSKENPKQETPFHIYPPGHSNVYGWICLFLLFIVTFR